MDDYSGHTSNTLRLCILISRNLDTRHGQAKSLLVQHQGGGGGGGGGMLRGRNLEEKNKKKKIKRAKNLTPQVIDANTYMMHPSCSDHSRGTCTLLAGHDHGHALAIVL